MSLPDGADRRRRELSRLYGGPKDDPEQVLEISSRPIEMINPEPMPETKRPIPEVTGWPFDAEEALRRQRAAGVFEKTIDIGGAVTMKLLRIPAGQFVMGDANGQADECPPARVSISRDFWIAACEVTNEQYHRHGSRPLASAAGFRKRPA
jgi:formylglycine-generating enzyme required for sulfatase activity